MKKKVYSLMMIAALVSFLGFGVENIWLLMTKGYINNRGMLFPALLGYGLAVIAIFLMFGTPPQMRIFGHQIRWKSLALKMLVYFLLAMLCVSIGEIILGTAVEKLCGIYWWDYSRLPLHITQYTSVPTSIGFSALIVMFMRYLFPPLYRYFQTWEDSRLRNVSLALIVPMAVDFVFAGVFMFTRRRIFKWWQLDKNGFLIRKILG